MGGIITGIIGIHTGGVWVAERLHAALGIKAPAYGRQAEPLEGAVAFVLASPSGRARSFWTLEPWREAAAFVIERRLRRERAACCGRGASCS